MNRLGRHFFSLFFYIKIRCCICYNRLLFWMLGVNYGRRLMIYNKVYIQGDGMVKIGDDFHFLSGNGINPICRNIKGAIYTESKESKILIGDRVGISASCLWAKECISIGNDVNIGGDCLLIDNDAHPVPYLKRRRAFRREVGYLQYNEVVKSAPIIIEDDVWIGARCQILKGVHIGARSVIAAGSVVTKDIPEGVIAGGNPCRVLKQLKNMDLLD